MRIEAGPARRNLKHLSAFLSAGVLTLALVSLTTPAHAAGTTRYVATTGADAGDCIDAVAPCATIEYAAGVADEGDEVQVAEGTYVERAHIAASGVTFTGVGAVVVDGGVVVENTSDVTLRGFEVRTTDDAIELNDSSGVVIEDVTLVARGEAGAGLRSLGSTVEIRESEVIGSFVWGLLFERYVSGTLDYTGPGLPVSVSNVTISGPDFGIILGPMIDAEVHGVFVSRYSEAAVMVGGIFFDDEAGAVRAAPRSASIVGNRFGESCCTVAPAITFFGRAAPGTIDVSFNQILGGARFFDGYVGLERNWWGSPAGGPLGGGSFDFDPWCLDPSCTTFSDGSGASDKGRLPPLPPYYTVPSVVSVTLDLGDAGVVNLPPRPKDEWIDEARALLPTLRQRSWFPDVIVEVDAAAGRVHVTVPEGADLSEYMHLLP